MEHVAARGDLPGSTRTTAGGGGGNMGGMNPSSVPLMQGAGRRARAWAGQFAQNAQKTVQQWTVPKYTLPDKSVASQVLMYRQLLHTTCRPGLKLSREYQATTAQRAVLHMPWWSEGIEETGKMVIAYDNLIRRLWIHGAIPDEIAQGIDIPTATTTSATAVTPTEAKSEEAKTGLVQDGEGGSSSNDKEKESGENATTGATTPSASDSSSKDVVENLPPIPHDYWVSRLGFQQHDPVTDFRSGGVLSLAMMVYMTESCPTVYARFRKPNGDASVLPFAITSINVTDMIAKFLMLAKSIDRMDALLSQKPFWRMFADPNALLACQEISMDMLADVVVELRETRQAQLQVHEQRQDKQKSIASPKKESDDSKQETMESATPSPPENDLMKKDLVTVFDFSHILQVTERRVEEDLLGAGPKTVDELREKHSQLQRRYKQQCQTNLERIRQPEKQQQKKKQQQDKTTENGPAPPSSTSTVRDSPSSLFKSSASKDGTGAGGDDAASTTTTNTTTTGSSNNTTTSTSSKLRDQVMQQAGAAAQGIGAAATGFGSAASHWAGNASQLAGNVFSKIKQGSSPGTNEPSSVDGTAESGDVAVGKVDATTTTASTTTTSSDDTAATGTTTRAPIATSSGGGGDSISNNNNGKGTKDEKEMMTEAMGQFSIGDDDDE